MPRRFLEVSGFVLAGGESRRMGRPKEQLALGNETMLARQIRTLQTVARRVAVLGSVEGSKRLNVTCIPDDRPGQGPLGAISTALGRTRTEFNLFLGCDMPFVEASFLRSLCREALRTQADATVPESSGGRLHPTCAVYRRRALKAVRASLERGDLSVRSFFPRVNCRVLRWTEIARAGFGKAVFENVNTPEEYRLALLRLDSMK
jgi:molybdenum cofactor guanylyltransferase